ncbi:MAG: hypothetical protein H6739_15410 [Alphaproteobacteria bacterium]|nr:hypothetical protein [Alphaproteobacteria bacterium]
MGLLTPPPSTRPLLIAGLTGLMALATPACSDKDGSTDDSQQTDDTEVAPTCGPCCHGGCDDTGDTGG